MSDIQAILFNKNMWNYNMAINWIEEHNFYPIKPVDITNRFYRFRIRDPKQFNKLRIKKTKDGIDFIFGFR